MSRPSSARGYGCGRSQRPASRHAARRQRRSAVFSLLALITLAVWTWSSVASFVDLTSFEHVTCEHGELIHVSPGTGPETSGPKRNIAAEAPAADRTHHEHCLAAELAGQRSVTAGSGRYAILITEDTLGAPGRARTAAAPVATLHLAPKSSPPASLS